ncbi:MAG: MFS transporter [Gammaproteobacteria bacterium]|nr:MFS transporter [Gammaproteobacteria bacterium]
MSEPERVNVHARTRTDAQRAVFYGWIIVGMGFVLQGLGTGTTQYLIGVFTLPFASEFHASRAAVLLYTQGILSIVGAVSGPMIGILMQRYSLRTMLLLAICSIGLGFIVLSRATELWHVAVAYAAFLSLGVGTITLGTASLATNWFSLARGRALGLMSAGTSGFGFVLPPLVTFWIGEYGWRSAWLILAGIVLAALPVTLWVVVDRPELRGLHPDGAPAAPDEARPLASGPDAAWTLRDVLSSRVFWTIALTISLCIGMGVAILANMIPFAVDKGSSPEKAAYLTSAIAAFALLGKIAFGFLADRIGQRLLIWIPAALLAAACVMIGIEPTYAVLFAGSIAVGLSFGALTPAWSLLVALNFGRKAFSLVMGATLPIMALAVAVSVPMAGHVRDLTGSYETLWWGFLVILGVVAIIARPLGADR